MIAPDLHTVLRQLFDAGATDVAGRDLDWSPDAAASVFRALNMLYISRSDTRDGPYFSLTRSGYEAIGERPPQRASILESIRLMFRYHDRSR